MKKILLFLTCFSLFLFADSTFEPSAQTAAEQLQSNTFEMESAFKKMLLVLTGLIFLVIATVWMIKRMVNIRLLQTNNLSSIKILEKRTLSPKSVLYIVEIDEKKVLISESQVEVRKISTLKTLNQETDS